jgi:hypothetical protein
LTFGFSDMAARLCPQIEEGEVDTERSRQFAICFRKAYKKELDAKRDQDRKEKAEARNRAQNL